MILAVSDVVWQAIIAAVLAIVMELMRRRTESVIKATGEEAASKVEQVKSTLKTTNEEATEKRQVLADKLDENTLITKDNSVKIEAVKAATDGMKDQLVRATEKEALLRGGVEERQRADDRTDKVAEKVADKADKVDEVLEKVAKVADRADKLADKLEGKP